MLKHLGIESFEQNKKCCQCLKSLKIRDDYESRLAQRKRFFNPENGDEPSMQSLEESNRQGVYFENYL